MRIKWKITFALKLTLANFRKVQLKCFFPSILKNFETQKHIFIYIEITKIINFENWNFQT